MQLECIIVGDGKRPIRSKTNGPGLENLPGRFVSSSSHLSLFPSFVRYHDENERAQLPIKKRGTVLSANEHCSGQIGDSGIPAGQTVKAALFLPLSVRLPPNGFRAEKPIPPRSRATFPFLRPLRSLIKFLLLLTASSRCFHVESE